MINNVVRVLESKFGLCINKSWAIGIFVLTSLISLSNFITLDRKRNLQKPGILPSFNTDASMFGESTCRGNLITAPAEFRPCHFCNLLERSKNLPKCLSLIVTFYILFLRFKINVVFMS